MRLANRIVLATTNPDKFKEFSALFRTYPDLELIPADSVLRNPEKLGFVERHDTYVENSIAKARLANHGCHYPVLADDSGIEVSALGGRPGVKSFRYAQVKGRTLSRIEQNRANNELLLSELKGRTGDERKARFVTTLALCMEGILIHATGTLEGTIADAPRGDQGFGYDSIFIPTGSNRTLAEMTENEKNAISHRGKALQELMLQVKARGIVFVKP